MLEIVARRKLGTFLAGGESTIPVSASGGSSEVDSTIADRNEAFGLPLPGRRQRHIQFDFAGGFPEVPNGQVSELCGAKGTVRLTGRKVVRWRGGYFVFCANNDFGRDAGGPALVTREPLELGAAIRIEQRLQCRVWFVADQGGNT